MKMKKNKYELRDEVLKDMSKEQLILKIRAYEDLLNIFYSTYFMLSVYLVDQSKWHITANKCLTKIRNQLSKSDAKIYLVEEEYGIKHY